MALTQTYPVAVPLRFAIALVSLIAALATADAAQAVERIERLQGFNGPVHAISNPDANGTRYLGGDFTAHAQWITGHGALTDATSGEVDPSLARITGGPVFAIEPDGTGGAFVAGEFTAVDGQTRYGLARILSDGSLDPGWTSGLTSAGDYILDIELSDGVLYAVGRFSTVATPTAASTQRSNAAAFNVATGALTAWDPATRANTSITTVSVDDALGYAWLGGNFTCVNARPAGDCSTTTDGNTVTALARVDLINGDKTSFPGIGGRTTVNASVLSADGAWLYIGGGFTTVGGQARLNAAVIRADTDSLTVGTWAPNLPSADQVLALEQVGGSIYIGGGFAGSVGGQQVSGLARFTADPTATATLTLAPAVSNPTVRTIHAVGTDIAIGGAFTTVEGEVRPNAARLTSDGTVAAWNPLPTATVFAIGGFGSDLLLGGSFDYAGGTAHPFAAAADRDGYLTDWSVNLNGGVRAIDVEGSTVYLGGLFTSAGGEGRKYAAAFSSSGDLLPWDPDLSLTRDNKAVLAMTIAGDSVYLGGSFEDVGNDRDFPYAAAFDLTVGSLRTGWRPEPNGSVYALASSNDTIYLGGDFGNVRGASGPVQRDYAAAFETNGTLVTGWDPDMDYRVRAIDLAGNVVYLGGDFTTTAGSQNRGHLAAFGMDGTLLAWHPDANNDVYTLTNSGDTVYFGGNFTNVGGQTINRAAAVDEVSGAPDASWNPAANSTVRALGATESTIYLGGDFTTIGGQTRNYSAAVAADGTLLDPWPGPLRASFELSVARSGTGSGTVTSSPSGIDCGPTCSSSYPAGTNITLTASADSSSTFSSWGGACSGTTSTCTVTMDQARAVTATFTASAGPTPPDNKATMRILSTKRSGPVIIIRARVSAPGTLRTVGTTPRRSTRTARQIACRTTARATEAGVVTLRCRLNPKTRLQLTQRSLRISLRTTYRPASGTETRSATRTVLVKRTTPKPGPVTG